MRAAIAAMVCAACGADEDVCAGRGEACIALRVDGLSAVMLLVVTGIGSLIHVYSVGYMRDDEGFRRFFAYLNLFLFSMLVFFLLYGVLLAVRVRLAAVEDRARALAEATGAAR